MRIRLRRRGIDHGWFTPSPRETSLARAEPVVLRRAVKPPGCRPELALIDRLRSGDDLAALATPPRGFRFTGVSQNTQDPLELHKLHVDPGDLYVKVNWLSAHRGDGSLRLRFSYGAEIVDDHVHDPRRVKRTLALVDALFPAVRVATRRFSSMKLIQPIVYSNQPDGGALFHHDFVPGQAGVVFTQLAGSTAWLTLPQRELQRIAGPRVDLDAFERLLNHTPAFTRRLADEGWLFVLAPGDALVLPSRTYDTAAWHSVFTVGRGGNLALSCGFTCPP